MDESINIFAVATQRKLRFPYRGQATVEDLWDLNREQLDALYKLVAAEKKELGEADGLIQRRTESVEAQNVGIRLACIKHVFDVKSEEERDARTAADKRLKKQRLMELLAEKQDEALKGKSEEELQALIAEL
jgi:hypothetical protein